MILTEKQEFTIKERVKGKSIIKIAKKLNVARQTVMGNLELGMKKLYEFYMRHKDIEN